MGKFLFVQDNGVNENIGVMSIAGVLKAGGHDVDLILIDEHPDNYLKIIADYNPEPYRFFLYDRKSDVGIYHSPGA